MSTFAPAQTLPVPQAITDPKQITSKPNAQVDRIESLSIEKLYMTRQVGGQRGRRMARRLCSSPTSAGGIICGWCRRRAAGRRS